MLKKMMIFLFLFQFLSVSNHEVFAEESEPGIVAEHGVVINADTGEVLYDKDKDGIAYPASITKIMTAMLLEEHIKDGQILTASEKAANQEGSQSYFRLQKGEKISKENAIKAMMIISANDVAMTIGENIAGSQEKFGEMMTERAKEIGAKNTHFTTPNGLPDPNHHTTAYDMALITREAIKHPEVLEAMSTKSFLVKTSKKEVEVKTPNKALQQPNVIAGKTGYTDSARNTLVEVLEKDGKRIIAVVLKTDKANEYSDINIMADYAFDLLKTKKIVEKGKVFGTNKIGSENVSMIASDSYEMTVNKGKEKTVKTKVVKSTLDHAEKGQTVGKLEVYYGEKKVTEIPLLSNKTVKLEKAKASKDVNPINLLIGFVITIPVYLVYFTKRSKNKQLKEEKKS